MKAGWQTKKLGEVCTTIQDGAHESPQTQYDSPGEGRFLYITSKNIRTNYLELKNVSYVDLDFHNRIYPRCSPGVGDVLLTKDGANTGNVCLNTIDQPFSLLSSVCLLKPNPENLNSGFLCYYLQSPDGLKSIIGQMTGAAIKRIILRDVKQASIPLPTLPEQERIVGILDEAFDGISKAKATAEANLQNARALFQSHLQTIFSQKGEGWVEKPLEQLVDILDSKRKPITKRDRIAGEYPYYGATGIQDYVAGFIFDEPLVLVGEDGAKWASGDNTAFAVSGRCWVNNHAHVLRPLRNALLDNWLIYFFNHSDLSEFVSGLTVPKLNQGSLRSIPIPVPPINVQERLLKIMDALLSETQRLESLYQNKLNALDELKKSLLHQAFTGNL